MVTSKVTIGIPTYNRLDLLKIMSSSLYNSDLSLSPNIRIYDDCSAELNIDILNNIFPTAKSIKINSVNLKADKNMYQMYLDFLSTEDDYFFNADSDIIFNKQWLNSAIEMIKKTDGVLSLFNTSGHKSHSIPDDTFCLKQTIGAAGTFFNRKCISMLLDHFKSFEQINSFDFQWSEYFINNDIRIFCVNNSLIQHIGYTGQNATLYYDIGKGFKLETVEDGQIINDILVNYMDKIKEIEKYTTKRDNNFFYHFYRCIIILGKIIIPTRFRDKLKKILNIKTK